MYSLRQFIESRQVMTSYVMVVRVYLTSWVGLSVKGKKSNSNKRFSFLFFFSFLVGSCTYNIINFAIFSAI